MLRPFAGRIGDCYGRRILITGGALIVAAAWALVLVAMSMTVLVTARVLGGIGEAAFFVGAGTMVTDLAPERRRGEALSYWSIAVYGGALRRERPAVPYGDGVIPDTAHAEPREPPAAAEKPGRASPAPPLGTAASVDLVALTAEVETHAHGRVPRELRRRQIIAVADQLFVERGYQAASMDEVAQRSGVTKPVIYDLFGSKEELFRTVMWRLADELADTLSLAVAAEQDPAGRLAAGALAFFTFVRDHRAGWYALLSSDATPVTVDVGEIRRRQTDLVIEMFAEGARLADTHVEQAMLEATAHAVNGAYESLARWWRDHPEVPAEQLAELVTTLVGPGLVVLATGAADATPRAST